MVEKTLLQLLNEQGAELDEQRIEKAFADLKVWHIEDSKKQAGILGRLLGKKHPDIETLLPGNKAKRLAEFLMPRQLVTPQQEHDKGVRLLPDNVLECVRNSQLFKKLQDEVLLKCAVLSILYTLLARKLGLNCFVALVNGREHFVCHLFTATNLVLEKPLFIDPVHGIFDKMPHRRFSELEKYFRYQNAFTVKDEYVAILMDAIMSKKDHTRAFEQFKKFSEEYPECIDARDGMTSTCIKLNKSDDECKGYLDKTIELRRRFGVF